MFVLVHESGYDGGFDGHDCLEYRRQRLAWCRLARQVPRWETRPVGLFGAPYKSQLASAQALTSRPINFPRYNDLMENDAFYRAIEPTKWFDRKQDSPAPPSLILSGILSPSHPPTGAQNDTPTHAFYCETMFSHHIQGMRDESFMAELYFRMSQSHDPLLLVPELRLKMRNEHTTQSVCYCHSNLARWRDAAIWWLSQSNVNIVDQNEIGAQQSITRLFQWFLFRTNFLTYATPNDRENEYYTRKSVTLNDAFGSLEQRRLSSLASRDARFSGEREPGEGHPSP
ncbi:hypothetical protein K488DRAFT_71675 [Vararia minispora EC-137]|uniref:Uncharacterized protein n=1 Tax=Vararia minispora EC-137 TaxID=1314806 RepID=A0ACB8QHB1_9AGAM|nr:hypothetical protein K488DRAFT_71675 [Vararia minispora EC-137]